MCEVVVTNDIHMLTHAEIVVIASRNGERKALFQGQRPRGLPAADDLIQHTVRPRRELLVLANRNLIHIAQDKTMRSIGCVHRLFRGQRSEEHTSELQSLAYL